MGFRLFGVRELGAKMGLWDPKWYPKNLGCLARTRRMRGELWVSEHPSRAQSTSDFVLLLRRTGEQSKYGGSTILEVSFDDLRHIKHQRYRSPNRLSNRHGPPKTEIRESLRDRLRKIVR